MSEENELVLNWIERHEALEISEFKAGSKQDELFWAFKKLDYKCRHEPEYAWNILLKILEKNPSVFVLDNLAAGPLEDLLTNYGDLFINRVENEAKENNQFKYLLGGVWQNDMPKSIWDRIQIAAGI